MLALWSCGRRGDGASVRPLIAADRFLKITMKGHIEWYVDDPQPSSSPPVHHQRAPGWSASCSGRSRWLDRVPDFGENSVSYHPPLGGDASRHFETVARILAEPSGRHAREQCHSRRRGSRRGGGGGLFLRQSGFAQGRRVSLPITLANVRYLAIPSECVPNKLGSSPMLAIHLPTSRAYCRVVIARSQPRRPSQGDWTKNGLPAPNKEPPTNQKKRTT